MSGHFDYLLSFLRNILDSLSIVPSLPLSLSLSCCIYVNRIYIFAYIKRKRGLSIQFGWACVYEPMTMHGVKLEMEIPEDQRPCDIYFLQWWYILPIYIKHFDQSNIVCNILSNDLCLSCQLYNSHESTAGLQNPSWSMDNFTRNPILWLNYSKIKCAPSAFGKRVC